MVPEDRVVPEDGVVADGRVVTGIDWPACGDVELGPSSNVVIGGPVVDVVDVVDVGSVVLVGGVELVGDSATGAVGLSPGFCHTDLVVASPVSGKSASWSATAEPAEARATTARMPVPAVRRSACESRGAA
ncbi:MAG: hypothetical protein AB8G14_16720 [Ilumatobacter sp.]